MSISLLEDTKVTDYGLTFDGATAFGNNISPSGDCIDIVGDYIFVTWYKGGMEDRHVMLSRKQIGTGTWKTIEFPHQHVGFRGDPNIGDNHNTIAVAVCPIDNTVHLLYDMHAYDAIMLPDDYFNYSVSVADAAFVPDDEWTIDLFYPKRNYLKAGVNYEGVTYPKFSRFDDGSLAVSFRIGGSGFGNSFYSFYDGSSWSNLLLYSYGTFALPSPLNYSVYGDPEYLYGNFHWGYYVRYASVIGEPYNCGVYYSYATYPYSENDWKDVNGEPVTLPIMDPNVVRIGDPTKLGVGDELIGTRWTVSANGSVHFMSWVSGTNVHYYKTASDTDFSYSFNSPSGTMYSIGQYIMLVGRSGGRIWIKVALAGTDQWETIYQETTGNTIKFGSTALENNTLVSYLMQHGSGDTIPLHVMVYSISDPDVDPPTPNPMSFAVAPYSTGESSIAMTAEPATDADENPVQYYFTCTSGNGHDSGWQNSNSYTDTDLVPETEYTYTVTARDLSANYNESTASGTASATTDFDTHGPTPDPMTWAFAPAPSGIPGPVVNLVLPANGGLLESFTSEYGGGWVASDLTNGVTNEDGWASTVNPDTQEFVFSFDNGCNAILNDAVIHGGLGEGTWEYFSKDVEVWISADGTSYTLEGSDTLLNVPNDSVTIELGGVVAKKVKLVVTSGYSTDYWELSEFIVNGSIVLPGDPETEITMTATTASDPSGVEYYFACVSGPGNDSGWQDSETYIDTGLTPGTQYTYTVTARDKSAAQNSTVESAAESATTTGCSTCGDIDGSGGNVDGVDFGLFAACWGENPSINSSCACANLVESGDNIINLPDFAVFAELFLSGSSNYPPNCSIINVSLDIDNSWMYQNLPGQNDSYLKATVLSIYDPAGNSSYTYDWEFILADDVTIEPSTIGGGEAADTFWHFAAPGANEPAGLSDSGGAVAVKVTVTGDDYGNTGSAQMEFGIALLGDVNNDTVVNGDDRDFTDAFWRNGSAEPFTLRDCDVNCDGLIDVADRSITNAIWRGILGANSVSNPCPFR